MNFIKEGSFYYFQNNSTPYLIASSFNASFKNDESIIKRLNQMSYRGDVYLDMLLTKGAGSSRFMCCYFNGDRFDTRKTKILDNSYKRLIHALREIEKQFCNKHQTLVENSILSYNEKLIAYGKIDS